MLADAHDRKVRHIVTFMDASKAFDVVCHQGMLNAAHKQGITGGLWNIYQDMYTNIQSSIKWKGEASASFSEGQGICLARLTSTELF